MSTHEDHDFHAIRGLPVGEEPDVAASVVRALCAESKRQGESPPSQNDHRLIGFFMAQSQLTLKVRVFGPTKNIREMNRRACARYWTAFCLAALEDASR